MYLPSSEGKDKESVMMQLFDGTSTEQNFVRGLQSLNEHEVQRSIRRTRRED